MHFYDLSSETPLRFSCGFMHFHVVSCVATTPVVGTEGFKAPEMHAESTYGPAADIYAMGVFFFELVTARLPYEHILDKLTIDVTKTWGTCMIRLIMREQSMQKYAPWKA